ncbi:MULTISPECIES: DNA repair protein RecO [unclassified Rhizobacter]|uniref:DNA repair protein RecO n=1 Tax=unclassified Rhizobacter TaxID=2640088 RepID=UPI0006F83F1D|nr:MULTISPECIES: DNA repair protein RecO [unclassified Rhizobacter]KQU74881.1 DNA repair protein RecO [Rhizobacter sp. Root29]KQW01044.1 DNA repair protein RecO [Rhizobacter sp. Root1238]KRB03894.1 DNA repair protein RecO [Rhizobacter sp. Root16D2]
MATRPARPPATQAAYVLHRYDWSESSLILDLFTREQGRIAVVAKGAKRPYSQLRPVLLPFQRIQVTLGKPPRAAESSAGSSGESASDVQTLRGAEWAGGHAMLTGAALFSGFYLNELLMKLLARSDAHPMLFDAYALTLALLASTDDGAVQTALRAFELALLQQVGVLPDLSRVTMTQDEVDPAGRYLLLPEQGVATSRGRENELAGQTLIGLQAALQHGSLAALQQACAPALQELKLLLRALLHYHLGSPVLRTRQVMLDVQALER